jgi:hypothetical protein
VLTGGETWGGGGRGAHGGGGRATRCGEARSRSVGGTSGSVVWLRWTLWVQVMNPGLSH